MLRRSAIRTWFAVLTGAAVGFTGGVAQAQCQQAKLVPQEGEAGDEFGAAMAVAGNYMIAGAPRTDGAGFGVEDAGAAYVFAAGETGWTQQAMLTAGADAAAGDAFGASVSITIGYCIAGVEFDGDAGLTSGSAYIFRQFGDTWVEDVKLTAGDDSAAFDHFGVSVAIDGDVALVGASFDDDNADSSGSVYVFERTAGAWDPVQKLTASDAGFGDQFGHAVALSGDYAVIGAPEDDGDSAGQFSSGSAYIFARTLGVWDELDKLTAEDATSSEFFGSAVAIDGDVAVVGADRDDDSCFEEGQSDCGAAYIFRRNGLHWVYDVKLAAADTYPGQKFGLSVSIAGAHVIVGTEYDNHAGTDSGAAYLFVHNGTEWKQQAKLLASDASARDKFGVSVAMAGDYALAGARGDDPGQSAGTTGSAYMFMRFDMLDLAEFQVCATGPPDGWRAWWTAQCAVFDCDGDNAVDLGDYANFSAMLTGPRPRSAGF